MNFVVLTLFKDMVESAMNTSIMGRAIEKGLINLDVIDIRDYACNKHNRVDDYPYGGGAGMVMQAEPVYKACEAARELIRTNGCKKNSDDLIVQDTIPIDEVKNDIDFEKRTKLIYLSPIGRTFTQNVAKELAREENIIFLCGHYEGIDERVLELEVDDYISLGDFVLTGGELPAICIMDAVARLVPGVLNNDDSASDESFEGSTLEYPQYTRPEEFMGKMVPEVLLSGHHANIKQWRREQSLIRTMERRPDLMENVELDKKDIKFLKTLKMDKSE